jgi:hypothetical protein
MPVTIRPFSADWLPAVREFNGRLDSAGIAAGLRLPEQPETGMLPGSKLYVAVEGDVVRGGYVLRPQSVSFHGEVRRMAHYRLPLSEGIINKGYAGVGPLLLRSALAAEPLLYAMGMGGAEQPLPRMLRAMGWMVAPVPFYFRVVHPARFLRNIRPARQNRWQTFAMDLAAWTGVGSIGLRLLHWGRAKRAGEPCTANEVDNLGPWAGEVWEAAHRSYGMSALRDGATMQSLYPASDTRFIHLEVRPAGWAVVLDTPMQANKYFGNLRVGTIADCMAKPELAAPVIRAARQYLARRGVDLIISNQSHAAWTSALRADGFLEGPSNYLFGASKPLSALAGPLAGSHINRGDGDGPVNL